ncbi:hypothetical protein F5Y04DRAFT_277761 [Hypomontagnella monticulosa]|nr:hypothetical protein F5Y04DRAFT_277761 [Hypomontagnella monticulosa]
MESHLDLEANISSGSPTVNQDEPTQPDNAEQNTWAASFTRLKARVFKGPTKEYQGYLLRPFEKYPNGYPRVGAFIRSDHRHLIFRQFHYLQARVILNLQDQLQHYERELELLDKPSTTSLAADASEQLLQRRSELLKNIEEKFEKYVRFLNSISFCSHKAEPLETDLKSLKNFFRKHSPLDVEQMYHDEERDLISLKPLGDTSMMDTRLMKFLLDAPNNLTRRIFRDSINSGRNKGEIAHDGRKVRIATGFLLGVSLIVLLVGPIYPLYSLSQGDMTEGTLVGIMFIQVGFTCAFACCLKYMTRPKRHELFACTVTYLGVLLVFMSQTLQKSH